MPSIQTPMAKAIVTVVLVILAALAVCGFISAHANKQIAAAQEAAQAAQVAQARAEGAMEAWKARATTALATSDAQKARADGLTVKIQTLERQIAKLQRPLPPTPIQSLPTTGRDLAAAFTALQLPAEVVQQPKVAVAFEPTTARTVLALVKDGQAYPEAVQRGNLLEQANGQLKEQEFAREEEAMAARQAAQDALKGIDQAKVALTDCDGRVKATEKERDAYKTKSRIRFIQGAGGGLLTGALLVLLL